MSLLRAVALFLGCAVMTVVCAGGGSLLEDWLWDHHRWAANVLGIGSIGLLALIMAIFVMETDQ